MPKLVTVPIDWASVNWLYVAVLSVFVLFSTLFGTLVSLKRAFLAAAVSTVLFAAGFVFWTYYPHGFPLPTSVTAQNAPITSATSSPAHSSPRSTE